MAKRSKIFDYDLIVLGSGAGGGVAAHIASRDGKQVAIVEQDTIGGECPNYGCVPTKALLHAAEHYRNVKESKDFGITITGANYNFKKVNAWKDLAVRRTGTVEGNEAFSREGITVLKGHAHFLDKHTISIHKRRYTARKFMVATGAHNFIPPIEGLKEAGYITHRGAINQPKAPKSLFVIGGGAIGCEFAFMFNSFDSNVIMAEYAPRLVFREDEEVGALLKAYFERVGISVLTATQVTKVELKKGKKVVHFKQNGRNGTATVDEILLAAGMRPNTDIGLENAGVRYDAHGIKTDDTMQTSAKHIYAAGDVVGPYGFTHMASYQSRVAVHNMFKRNKIVAKYHAVPRVIYTTPEVATVGLTEEQLKKKHISFKTNAVPIDIIGRSNTTNQDVGFVKVITSKSGVLLGASIIAPRAGEMIHELALAVNLGLKAEDVASTIHAFPTWSEAVRVATAGL